MLTVVTGHHERYDGTGYPDGLAGEQISIYARITAVADTYDAMTSARAYRPDMGKEWAIGELEKGKGTQFDPRLVDVFIEILREESSKYCFSPYGLTADDAGACRISNVLCFP